jgi:flagellar basal-body rod protein FlgB
MLDALFGPAVPVLQGALGFEAARERVIAHNIANVNTPGFQAKDLFRTMLSDEQGKLAYEEGAIDAPAQREDGNNVDPESQMVNLTETEVRYRALTSMTSRYFHGMRSVIAGDGK